MDPTFIQFILILAGCFVYFLAGLVLGAWLGDRFKLPILSYVLWSVFIAAPPIGAHVWAGVSLLACLICSLVLIALFAVSLRVGRHEIHVFEVWMIISFGAAMLLPPLARAKQIALEEMRARHQTTASAPAKARPEQ
jgi:hypothetical protein